MKNTIFFALTFVFAGNQYATAQCPTNLICSTQADIDSFSARYPACMDISGSVAIRGKDIEHLDGLMGLRSVGGDLEISGADRLKDLTGLEAIRSLNGGLTISRNPALANLSGLDHVKSAKWVEIFDNQALTNIKALDSLRTIDGDLKVIHNVALENLSGLDHPLSIGGGLELDGSPLLKGVKELRHIEQLKFLFISGNAALTDLAGLEQITALARGLRISFNNALTNLEGLKHLKSVGTLEFHANNSLHDLTGLEHLESIHNFAINQTALRSLTGLEQVRQITGGVSIFNNIALNNLNALDGVQSISKSLHIEHNPLLTMCALPSFCGCLESPFSSILIENNAPGCDTRAEVWAACRVPVENTAAGDHFIALSPNPSSGMLRLQSSKQGEGILRISDGRGRLVLEQGFYGETSIDLTSRPGGIYFFRVEQGNGRASGKIVKE